MNHPKITVEALIEANLSKVWDYYTQPEHITQWNFADPSWHCPSATNDFRVGGLYSARMEAKDGSFGFDFDATYLAINYLEEFTYEFGGRIAHISFAEIDHQTKITVQFDPENEFPLEIQEQGWQAILNNFKVYVENQ
jgi:uncharacterized protein YndB with AHSA1/START domain